MLIFFLPFLFFSFCGNLFSANLTVDTYTVLQPGTYSYDNVIVNDTLLCRGDTVNNSGVIINCLNLTVNAGGRITADCQGYPTLQGPGKSFYTNFGASHGGYGASTNAICSGVPAPYGSMTAPLNLGSGGSNFGASAGGGAIAIFAENEVQINLGGVITANADLYSGSGGSVYIRTKILSGQGSVLAEGGTGYGNSVTCGEGGGGRIAIYYESNTFDLNNVSAKSRGGSVFLVSGSGGTVYVKPVNQTYGDLIIDAKNGARGNEYYGNHTPLRGTLIFDTVVLRNNGKCQVETGAFLTVTNIYSNNTNNTLRCDGNINKNKDLTVNENVTIEINTPQEFSNVTIKANGKLSHTGLYYDTQPVNRINATVYGNFTIEPGGSIDVNGKGYAIGAGPGAPVPASTNRCGGSYGGVGGAYVSGTDTPSPVYGSETAPIDPGSGSTSDIGIGKPGGGSVYLFVMDTLRINGGILAEGQSYYYGGSGGAVYINAVYLEGTSSGKVSVKGGSGIRAGGGGGRIAVYYYSDDYDGVYDTSTGGGGAVAPGVGTRYMLQKIFHLPPRQTVIDNPAYSSPITGRRPSFKWLAPEDVENGVLHFDVEISQDSSFVTTPTVSVSTNSATNGFQYSTDDGITWGNFPSAGVASDANPAIRVMFTVQQDLQSGDWYWRVRAKDIDGNGQWSTLGYLPSIIGDITVKIETPGDSDIVYDEKIRVEGTIQQSVSQTINVNGVSNDLTLTDNKFSLDVGLELGNNTITVTGYGLLGNAISAGIVVTRLRVPMTSNESTVSASGGTVRLDDYDGDPDNDARVEIGEGVFNGKVTVSIEKSGGEYPIYDVKADKRHSTFLKKKVKLTLSYKGMKISGSDEDKAGIFYWDSVRWQAVGGVVNKEKKTVTCWVNHLSRYGIMLVPDAGKISVNVSPEIFTPNGDGINDFVLINVTAKEGGKFIVTVYDITGKIVKRMEEDAGIGGSYAWDGRDEEGKLHESGIYLYSVSVSGKICATGTFAIAK